ncbi:MAG: secretion protein F, partial [Oscillospiraceae bacterium]
MISIYDIALYAAVLTISLIFGAGIYCFSLILLKVPSRKTTKAIKAVAARNRPTAVSFKNTYNDISLFVSKFIHLNQYKKKELADSLKIANIAMTPELFTARALVKSAGIMLLSVPLFFIFPILGILMVVLSVMMYFREKQQVDNCIKEKRRQIEFDLPRFVYAISQETQMTHDVITILERHKDNFSSYFNEEIEITIADMRTGNYEAAITRFEGRIGSTNLSEVCRGLIEMIRGNDTHVYWET